jgi:hypothetical protein
VRFATGQACGLGGWSMPVGSRTKVQCKASPLLTRATTRQGQGQVASGAAVRSARGVGEYTRVVATRIGARKASLLWCYLHSGRGVERTCPRGLRPGLRDQCKVTRPLVSKPSPPLLNGQLQVNLLHRCGPVNLILALDRRFLLMILLHMRLQVTLLLN